MVDQARDPVKAADSVFEKLKNHQVQGAANQFRDEIYRMEKAGGNVANNEAKFLQELAKKSEAAGQNEQLKKLGFPEIHITQSGEQIRVSFADNGANGSFSEQSVDFEFTQYSRQHQTKGVHELQSNEFKISEAPKPQQPTNNLEVGRTNSGAYIGNVRERHQLEEPPQNPPTDASPNYPKPVYVSDNRMKAGASDDQFRNPDGSWNYDSLAAMGGPMLTGHSRHWRDQFHSSYIDTDIYLPQNALQRIGGGRIVGHLPSGDPINGSIVRFADGPHFVGTTTPFSVGYGRQVSIDARLHY
ncbi:MAG: hypothetical protein K2Y22_16460 [Candidatus Obscuribacterales bacterium]|nr:hypothetical protein [Candidatus Obscuribacterales bacterium]